MISYARLEEQMKRISFHYKGWGRTEVNELCNILMPQEEIEECVNGYYEAGFALLVATKDRVLLVDKKPLGYLTVHDMRFDMINELDLHHRLFGAQIRISAGNKILHFTSMNQVRLRRLLNYVQARMTTMKREMEGYQTQQKQHLEEMNEQLRLYLMAAHKQQFLDQANSIRTGTPTPGSAVPAAMTAPQGSIPLPPVDTSNYAPKTSFEQAAWQAFTTAAPPRPDSTTQSDTDTVTPQMVPLTPQQLSLNAARRVVPVISAYTRLPLVNQRRRFETAPKF